jgi:ATP-dependent Clp protease adaptor protein ClpS
LLKSPNGWKPAVVGVPVVICVLAAAGGLTHISVPGPVHGLGGGAVILGAYGTARPLLWFYVGFRTPVTMLQFASTSISLAASAPRMSNDDRTNGTSGPATSVITRVKSKTKRPNLYRVLILNDDYTPMEFVVLVLEKFFQKDVEAATKIMLHVHHHGIGECGVFTYEIAETKVTQVMDFARKHQHPLQCVMEKK